MSSFRLGFLVNLIIYHVISDTRILYAPFYSAQIGRMGLTYRAAWIEGKLDRTQLASLEDTRQLLLLCLSAFSFDKADPASLVALCKDLDLSRLTKEAVIEWELQDQYPAVSDIHYTMVCCCD